MHCLGRGICCLVCSGSPTSMILRIIVNEDACQTGIHVSNTRIHAVVAGTPDLLFGAVQDHHEWAPKVIPHIYKDGDRREDDGEAGSVYHYDIHEDAHDAHGGNPKLKVVMEDYNESTLSYAADSQGDPRYSHLNYSVRFLPGPSPGTTTLKCVIDYAPLTKGTPPPDELITNLPLIGFIDLAAHFESAKSEKH